MKYIPKVSPYPRRSDNYGLNKTAYNERFDPLLIKAIDIYKKWHKETYGFEASRSDIFATSVLQQNDRIRDIYRKLEQKERKGGRKYLDGIKTQRTHVSEPTVEDEIRNMINIL